MNQKDVYKRQIFFQHAADKYAEDANFKMLDICHVAALVVQALRVAIPTFLVAAVVSPEGCLLYTSQDP